MGIMTALMGLMRNGVESQKNSIDISIIHNSQNSSVFAVIKMEFILLIFFDETLRKKTLTFSVLMISSYVMSN